MKNVKRVKINKLDSRYKTKPDSLESGLINRIDTQQDSKLVKNRVGKKRFSDTTNLSGTDFPQ